MVYIHSLQRAHKWSTYTAYVSEEWEQEQDQEPMQDSSMEGKNEGKERK